MKRNSVGRSLRHYLAVTAALLLCTTAGATALDLEREDVRQFIDELVSEHKLDPAWIRQNLATSKRQQSILDAISRPAEAVKPWHEYRAIFIQPERIAAGVDFYALHCRDIDRIAADTGVSASMILGIVGVESYFGRITGRHRVLDALTTLGFDYPPRATFFRRELGQAFLLAREEQLDLNTLTGSYAGAMGPPQFIPSSYRAYAVDGDGDGKRDLLGSWPDIFASIANYFVVHKWQSGKPVAAMATLSEGRAVVPFQESLDLRATVGELSQAGVMFATELEPAARAGVWKLDGVDAPEYWIGFNNLYVITRYNRSVMYSIATWQLGEAIVREIKPCT